MSTDRIRTDAEAKAAFEADNEIRRIVDPQFDGSAWDNDWDHLQPYCQRLYTHGKGY